MTTEFEDEAVEAAILLENRVKERIKEVALPLVMEIINKRVAHEVEKQFREKKQAMMNEIAITIGRLLVEIEKEDRKPLWETKPEDIQGLERS